MYPNFKESYFFALAGFAFAADDAGVLAEAGAGCAFATATVLPVISSRA